MIEIPQHTLDAEMEVLKERLPYFDAVRTKVIEPPRCRRKNAITAVPLTELSGPCLTLDDLMEFEERSNMNKIVMCGRLTKDPELRTTNNGTEVCGFSLSRWMAGLEKNSEKETDFIDCTAWEKAGVFVNTYFQ